MLVYKYRSINKNTIESLVNATLHFSNPNEFNDPFDSNIRTNFNGASGKIVKHILQTDGLWLPDKIFDSNYENEEYLNRDIEVLNKKHSDFYFRKSAMCCFSKQKNNILMWSHYADSHKGIVLGFKVIEPSNMEEPGEFYFLKGNDERFVNMFSKNGEDPNILPIWPVLYSDNKPDELRIIEKTYDMFNKIRTKAKYWSYEEELRVIFLNPIGDKNVEFDREILQEAYFGINTSESDAELIKSIISKYYNSDIHFYKAVNSQTHYELNFIEV
jgi:hypothetical protein